MLLGASEARLRVERELSVELGELTAIGKPKRAMWFAFVCTIGSVIGGIIGYYIGFSLFEQGGVQRLVARAAGAAVVRHHALPGSLQLGPDPDLTRLPALDGRPVLHEVLIAIFMTLSTPVTYMLLLRAARWEPVARWHLLGAGIAFAGATRSSSSSAENSIAAASFPVTLRICFFCSSVSSMRMGFFLSDMVVSPREELWCAGLARTWLHGSRGRIRAR